MKHALLMILLFCCGFAYAQKPKLIPYRDGKKWGYSDWDGKVVIQPQWDEAEPFRGSRAVVKLAMPLDKWGKNKAVCLIDETGKYIIPPSFHWNGEWDENREQPNAYGDDGKAGWVDTNGFVKIPLRYDNARYRTHHPCGNRDFISVLKDEKEGMVNESGQEVLPARYRVIPDCKTSNPPTFYAYRSIDTVVLTDTTERIIYMFEKGSYGHRVERLHKNDNAILLKDNDKVYYWKDYPDGKPVLLPYDDFSYESWAHPGFVQVRQKGKYGMIDTNAKEIIKPRFDEMYIGDKVIIAENSLLKNNNPKARYEHVYLDETKLANVPALKATDVSEIERYRREQAEGVAKRHETNAMRNGMTVPVDKVLDMNGHPLYQKGKYIIDLGMHDRDAYIRYTPAAIYDTKTKKLLGFALVHADLSLASPITQWNIPKFSSISLVAVIEKDGRYGIADSNMKQLIAFQPFMPDVHNYTVRNGKPYVLVLNYGHENNPQVNKGHMFIDAEGKVPPQFEPYTDIAPAAPGEGYRTCKYFIARNKAGKTGVIDFDGHVQYDHVSFLYDIRGYYGNGLFLVADPATGRKVLVDGHGQMLFKNIAIETITPAYYQYFAYSGDYPAVDGLYKVFLNANLNNQVYFYMNDEGRAYVGSWEF